MDTPYGFASLLPPLVAIGLAMATRRVVLPLAAGVFIGAVLLSLGHSGPLIWLSSKQFAISMYDSVFMPSHLKALTFSLTIGAMVGVLEGCGGMRALIALLSRRIHTRRGAQSMIAFSGLAIFFDDYANTLLIGGTMRSTVDRYRISREKLAYLVDSTAAPVAGLALISTWAAVEISYMSDGLRIAGIEDPSAGFRMFIYSIPYRFYPWLAIVMVMLVAILQRDFGPMLCAESMALQKTETPSDPSPGVPAKSPQQISTAATPWLWMAAVLPVVVCIIAVIATLVLTGGREGLQNSQDQNWLWSIGKIMGAGDSYLSLIVGGVSGLLIAIAAHLFWGRTDLRSTLWAALLGAWQMVPAVVILWFAWALSGVTDTDQLDTGGYLASVLSDRIDPRLLPTTVFVTAGLVAFATGTSWGTMGILTPLSIALALKLDPAGGADGPIVLATCGAVLAGAIFGDHCSPISDTTVLSSRSSGCDHVAHVRTQMPYALTVAIVCIVFGTLPVVVGMSPWIGLLLGTVTLALVLYIVGKPARETHAVKTDD